MPQHSSLKQGCGTALEIQSMTKLSKEQDAEPKSLLESLVTEIYLEKIDVNLFTAEIVEKNDQHFGVKTKSFSRMGGREYGEPQLGQ